MPAISLEATRCIVGEPALGLAVDRDAIVVVERGQLAQAQRPCQRTRLVRYPLHETAVADHDIGAMIDDSVTVAVEFRREKLLRQRHSHRVGESLSEWAGRRFHTGRHADLGMSWRFGVQLAKALQLFDRQRVSGQMQQRILQHRAVAVGEYEAVAIRPMRIRRVVAQMTIPERDRDFGHPHRHSRMTGVGRLHSIHRQGADGVREQRGIDNGPARGSGTRRRGGRCVHGRRSWWEQCKIESAVFAPAENLGSGVTLAAKR